MTKEEQFKKELEEKIEKALKEEDRHNKGVIINDDNHDWGGCPFQYDVKQDLI